MITPAQRRLATFDRIPPQVGAEFCRTTVMLEDGRVVALRVRGTGSCDLDRMLVENRPPRNGRSCYRDGVDEAGDRWVARALALGSGPRVRDRRHHARSGSYRGLAEVRAAARGVA